MLFGALILIVFASNAYGQEAGMSDVDLVREPEAAAGEKLVFSPDELTYIPKTTATPTIGKDSIALNIQDFPMQQAALKAASEKDDKQTQKQKDDSILTFNFLYYIIQKYKLQDIID